MTWSEIQYYDKFAYQIAEKDPETSIGLLAPWGDADVAVILGFRPGTPTTEQESALLPSYIDGYPVCYIDEVNGYYPDYISFTGNKYLKEVVFPITLLECKRGLFTGCTSLTTVVINHLFASNLYSPSGLELFLGCRNLQFILNRSRYIITREDFNTPSNNLTIYRLDNSGYGDDKNYGKVLRGRYLTQVQGIKILYASDSADGSEISSNQTPLLAVVQGGKALIVGTIKEPLDDSYDYSYQSYGSYAQTQVSIGWEEPVKIDNPGQIRIGKPLDTVYKLYTSDYFQTGNTITLQDEEINEFEVLPYAFCGFDSLTTVSLNADKIGEKAFLNSFDSTEPNLSASVECRKCWIGADGINYTKNLEVSANYNEGGLDLEPFAVAENLNTITTALSYGCEFTDWETITEATCTSTGLQARFCKDRVEYRGTDLEQWSSDIPDHEYETRPIAKLEHSMQFKANNISKEPTCTEEGYSSSEVWKCENCDYIEYVNVGEILPKVAHTFEESADGKIRCSMCNAVLSGAPKYFWKKANWIQKKLNLYAAAIPFPIFEYDKILQNTFAKDAYNLQARIAYDYLIFDDSEYGYLVSPIESAKDIVHLVIPTYSPEGEQIKGIYGFENFTKLQSVQLPEGLEIIDHETFSGCSNLTQVKLPQSLKELGDNVFQNTKVKNISLPCVALLVIKDIKQTCTTVDIYGTNWGSDIPDHCFENAVNLAEVNCLDVYNVGARSFAQSGLQSISFDSTNTAEPLILNLGEAVFAECENLSEVEFKNIELRQIPKNAFYLCHNLSTFEIPKTVTKIGYGAFYGGSFDFISIPESVKTIDEFAFASNSVNSIIFENRELSEEPSLIINNAAFSYCTSIVELNLPEGTISLGEGAFEGCTALATLNLPKSLLYLADYSFQDCTHLYNIIYKGTRAEWQNISKDENWNLRVPAKEIHCTDGIIPLTT